MENCILKYKNDINKIRLGALTSKEQDIFFSLIYKAQKQNEREIIIDFVDVAKLTDDNKNSKRLISNMRTLSKKLSQLSQEIKLPNGNFVIFNLFDRFVIDINENFLKVNVNEDFKFLLNDLIGTFTKFELRHLVELKSSYSKIIFRMLKQFQSTGWYEICLTDFKESLGVPETYSMDNVNQRVLKPILKELPTYFPNLKIEKIKKGRSIDRLKFTWDVKEIEIIKKYEEIDEKIPSEKIALKAAIPALSNKDIEVLLKSSDMPKILEKYYTLAVGKEIENLTGFLLSAIKNDWKTVAQAEKEFKKETGEMDELEAKIQKRLYLKLAEKEKNKDSQNH